MKFTTNKIINCGIKHIHKRVQPKKHLLDENKCVVSEKPFDYQCCNCGNNDFSVSHYPVEPPLGHSNWDDRYHLKCNKCNEEVGMWELPEKKSP